MESPANPAPSHTRLLRPDEVAATLNISKSLAYRLLQQGQIPTIRFNRTVRVRQVDLEAYIKQCWHGSETISNPD